MKITKARLKQIIKEEMKSLEEKKRLDPYEADAEHRQSIGQATWEDEEDAQQTLPSDTQTPASAADINPIGAKIGQAIVNPVQAAKDAATAAGFGKFFQDPKKVEPAKDKAVKAAKATKSGGGGLKAAKARMSAARKKVKIAMKAAGVSSIYKLPKTDGSPRKEFADAYTALKRAKAGKAPKPRLKSDPKSPRAMGKPAPKTSPTRAPRSGEKGAPSTFKTALDKGAKADANRIINTLADASRMRGNPMNKYDPKLIAAAYNYAAKENPEAAGQIQMIASNYVSDKFANSLGKKTVKKESKSLDHLVDLIMEKMINENI